MPFQTEWLVPNAVIMTRFFGEATKEDMITSGNRSVAMIDSCDAQWVHIIVDSTAATTSPSLPATISTARSTPIHERAGWVLTVGGQNVIVKLAMGVARELMHLRTQSFDTVDEAIAFLKSADEAIDWSQARTELLTTR
ncbi:MAG: hypothetical protein KJ065_11715 [Anaerolineae bacterium]|nr:hypothetical protein [Anaerolineae bacterium]